VERCWLSEVVELPETPVPDDAAEVEVALGTLEVFGRDRDGVFGGLLLDVRQLPGLVEERLLRTVEAEEDLEPSPGSGGDPVRLLAFGGLRPEVDVDRAVGVLLKARRLGRATEPLPVAYERVGLAVVDRR